MQPSNFVLQHGSPQNYKTFNMAAPQNAYQHNQVSDPSQNSNPLRIFKHGGSEHPSQQISPPQHGSTYEIFTNKALTIFFTQQPPGILIMTADQNAPQYSSPSGLFYT